MCRSGDGDHTRDEIALLRACPTVERATIPHLLGTRALPTKRRARAPQATHHRRCSMSVQTVGHKFAELCRQGKNFDVMRTMYAPDIVSVEGDGKETAGQQPVIKKSEDWVSDKTFHGETVAGPFFNGANPDQFAVYFTLDVTPKATGRRITLEEVAVYTVNAHDLITREQFFYEGAH
jgi:hypothetical protein